MKPPDWESLLRRLTAVALGWFGDRNCRGEDAVLPGTGSTAKDLAYSALLEFLRNEGKYRVKSDDDRYRLIVTIMKRDFFDLVKPRREHSRTVILDAQDDREGYEKLSAQQDTRDVAAAIETASEANRYYHLAEGEQPLIDFIDAAADFGHLPRKELAELVRVTPDELTNMKKKLRYRSSRPHSHDRAKAKGGSNAKS
jgi:hypothetical protein